MSCNDLRCCVVGQDLLLLLGGGGGIAGRVGHLDALALVGSVGARRPRIFVTS